MLLYMSIANLLSSTDQSYLNIYTNTISSGILFSTVFVPIGTTSYRILTNSSNIVCLAGETLSSVTWTLPKASTCPGLQMSLINKSTSTTINLMVQSGDFLPSYLSPAQIPPSGGSSNDQFYYFQSDGIDTWQ
jgi:hypothetical protein